MSSYNLLYLIYDFQPYTYTSVRKGAYLGLDGELLFDTGEETSTATRIRVEPAE